VLRRAGFYVDVFEQDRVVGGRMGTARMGIVPFDHGAQYVTARMSRFKAYLEEVVASGYAARWTPRAATGEDGEGQMSPWHVGTPGMSSIVRPLAENVRMLFGRRVHTLQRTEKSWSLWFDDQTYEGPFAAVAVAVPAPEAQFLLGRLPELSDPLARVRMQPCWALMVRLDQRVLPEQDVFSDMSQVVRWISRNNSKPLRTARGDHIIVHAAPAWTRQTEDLEPEAVAEELWAEVSHALSLPHGRRGRRLVQGASGRACVRKRCKPRPGDHRRPDLNHSQNVRQSPTSRGGRAIPPSICHNHWLATAQNHHRTLGIWHARVLCSMTQVDVLHVRCSREFAAIYPDRTHRRGGLSYGASQIRG
jgi:predicted NAD/FAD-dependent oxidoreductase